MPCPAHSQPTPSSVSNASAHSSGAASRASEPATIVVGSPSLQPNGFALDAASSVRGATSKSPRRPVNRGFAASSCIAFSTLLAVDSSPDAQGVVITSQPAADKDIRMTAVSTIRFSISHIPTNTCYRTAEDLTALPLFFQQGTSVN